MHLRPVRHNRLLWSRWLIASLLFLQLATAAYACSRGLGGTDEASMVGMPCAQAMGEGFAPALDPDQPGLCLEHCKGGSQTVDSGPAGALPLPALVALYRVPAAAERGAESPRWQARQRERNPAPPPAHSVLHCCYRL